MKYSIDKSKPFWVIVTAIKSGLLEVRRVKFETGYPNYNDQLNKLVENNNYFKTRASALKALKEIKKTFLKYK